MTEVLVSRARVAVPAAELAAPKRIHCPPERHTGPIEAIHQVLGPELLKYGSSPLVDDRSDALDEAGRRQTAVRFVARHVMSFWEPKNGPGPRPEAVFSSGNV